MIEKQTVATGMSAVESAPTDFYVFVSFKALLDDGLTAKQTLNLDLGFMLDSASVTKVAGRLFDRGDRKVQQDSIRQSSEVRKLQILLKSFFFFFERCRFLP